MTSQRLLLLFMLIYVFVFMFMFMFMVMMVMMMKSSIAKCEHTYIVFIWVRCALIVPGPVAVDRL